MATSWPTKGLVNPAIPGQLAWPTVSGGFSGGAITGIPNAIARTNIITASGSGRYLDQTNKLYEQTSYVGLRGVFYSNNEEDVKGLRSLRRYMLWRWLGYAPGIAESGADRIEIEDLHTAFKNEQKQSPQEPGLSDKRNMYFFDGRKFDSGGNPVLTLYYKDGQGRGSENEGEVGVDFYQMKYLGNAGMGEDVSAEVLTASGSYSVNMHGTESGAAYQQQLGTSTVEYGAGGTPATETAYENVYADTLAWDRLLVAHFGQTGSGFREGGLTGQPLLSLYNTMREDMLIHGGSILQTMSSGADPDKTQSHIISTIETRLRDEGYSDALIDFFINVENISTITPEGYRDFGFNQSLRAIPAGTPATQIQGYNTPHGHTGGLSPFGISGGGTTGTGGTIANALNSVTVVGPLFHLRAPNAEDVAGYGPNGFEAAKIVQLFPEWSFAGYTSRALATAIDDIEEFVFPYAPNDIQYQGLGAKWVEVPRTGDLPLLEFAQWTLMKVSMEFVVANPGDGLRTSVYDQLEKLRRMAQRPFPVSIFGLDQLLRVSMKRAEITGKPLEFVIGDLSISSLQRTIRSGDKEITSARVKMTLQEIPIEESIIHAFRRPIVVPNIAPPDGDEGGAGTELLSPEALRGAAAAGGVENEFGIASNTGNPPPFVFNPNAPVVVEPPVPEREILDYGPET